MTFMEWLKTDEGRMASFNDMLHALEIAYNAGQNEAIAAAVQAEREACAEIVKSCDRGEQSIYGRGVHDACVWIEDTIRARSEAQR